MHFCSIQQFWCCILQPNVGPEVVAFVSLDVGPVVGAAVATVVGPAVGAVVGCAVGEGVSVGSLGARVGIGVGLVVGADVVGGVYERTGMGLLASEFFWGLFAKALVPPKVHSDA